jgi:hypothetical protein
MTSWMLNTSTWSIIIIVLIVIPYRVLLYNNSIHDEDNR